MRLMFIATLFTDPQEESTWNEKNLFFQGFGGKIRSAETVYLSSSASLLEHVQQTRVYPYPLGRRVCETKTKSKNGRSRPRKPFISRVFFAQRGVETMVSDHGLGRGHSRVGNASLFPPPNQQSDGILLAFVVGRTS